MEDRNRKYVKPTKDNLIDEIKYRLNCIENTMKEHNDVLLCSILANEHSLLSEVNQLINVFENRIGYSRFEVSKYTPLKCSKTNEPLLIGDKVEDDRKQCGTLHFDSYTKKYVIKSEEGGNIHTRYFVKISELYDYNIDIRRVECRGSNRYLKKRW